jgi:uncharacterized protein YkwD
VRIPGALPTVALSLSGVFLCACSGMDVWERPYVASHRSPPVAVPRAASPADLPAPVHTPAPVAPRPLAPPRSAAGESPAAAGDAATAEDRATFDEVNRIRTSRGMRAFRWNSQLFQAALDHSKEQDKHKYMGHGSPDPRRDDLGDRIRMSGYRARAWAEVVAWGYRGPAHVVQGWMNSKGHREILMDPSLLEAGFSRVGDYFTGNFGTPLPAAPRPVVRSAAAPVPRSSAPAPSR